MIKGFICGAFDLFHPGHVSTLQKCKTHCDYLIVGLQTDPTIDRPEQKSKPVQSMFERFVQLEGSRYVDQIVPYDTEHDLENMLSMLDINVRFLGADYIRNYATGIDICQARGIEIVYIERNHGWSTTELRRRIENEYSIKQGSVS